MKTKFLYPAAVGGWYTSSGRFFPKLVVYERNDGKRYTIENITLENSIFNEQSTLIRMYQCSSICYGRVFLFTLIFHPRSNNWEISF